MEALFDAALTAVSPTEGDASASSIWTRAPGGEYSAAVLPESEAPNIPIISGGGSASYQEGTYTVNVTLTPTPGTLVPYPNMPGYLIGTSLMITCSFMVTKTTGTVVTPVLSGACFANVSGELIEPTGPTLKGIADSTVLSLGGGATWPYRASLWDNSGLELWVWIAAFVSPKEGKQINGNIVCTSVQLVVPGDCRTTQFSREGKCC